MSQDNATHDRYKDALKDLKNRSYGRDYARETLKRIRGGDK